MGTTSYSTSNRRSRSVELNYTTVTAETMHTVFKQKAKGKAHDSMLPQGVTIREARDSEAHPNTFPVIIALDMTGSMHQIPVMLIRDGLPKLVSSIIQRGVKDITLLFIAIGDHEVDDYPLQVGQFESGDEELDLWLTRTYPEGGGGPNGGESYGIGHYFASKVCVTDAWEKRGQKGVYITIGDEPSLDTYTRNAVREITGNPQAEGFTQDEILAEVREKWEVFHINPHNSYDKRYWEPKLGQHYVSTSDYNKVPEIITDIVCRFASITPPVGNSSGNDISQSETESSEDPTTSTDEGTGFVK